MLSDLISAFRELSNFRDRLRSARGEDREALATYVDSIADCLKEISSRGGQRDTVPFHDFSSSCAQLGHYADNCSAIIETVLGPKAGRPIAERIQGRGVEDDG